MSIFKKIAINICPPIIYCWLKRILRQNDILWKGNFNSWEEAQKVSSGYETQEIINKVKESLLKVKNGEVAFERDSVLFEKIEYSWAIITGLMWAAALNNGTLRVLDFGGSLGSSYFQNKKFLKEIGSLKWGIVEQPAFVKIGKKEFEDDHLKFFMTPEECVNNIDPKVILLSSVLSYIQNPYKLLNKLLQFEIQFIFVDRTPFLMGREDRLVVQKAHPSIYQGSYPAWIFSEEKFLNSMMDKYDLIEDFITIEGSMEDITFKGFLFKRSGS